MELNRKNVLLLEDMKDMQLIVRSAIENDCTLTCVSTINDAERELGLQDISLLILDVNLPDGDGFEFCQKLRARREYSDLPIIFLTSETETRSRVLGFTLGADDYVTKPIEPEEFAARVISKLRKSQKPKTNFQSGRYKIDLALQRACVVEGELEKDLSLTPIEFKLFSNFLKSPGRVFSRAELLETFWGGNVHVSGHTVDTHISSLRKKLGTESKSIRSVFKKGYSFSPLSDETNGASLDKTSTDSGEES